MRLTRWSILYVSTKFLLPFTHPWKNIDNEKNGNFDQIWNILFKNFLLISIHDSTSVYEMRCLTWFLSALRLKGQVKVDYCFHCHWETGKFAWQTLRMWLAMASKCGSDLSDANFSYLSTVLLSHFIY